jgi:predicted nucleotidyltransferase
LKAGSLALRKRVAREAATLIYSGVEKEYKQAKMKAAKMLGIHFLPSNLEVAMEFDNIAEENEGQARQERLVWRRREALKLMKILKSYSPVLIGSVWRGTAHCESDIDIVVYHDEPNDIIETLKQTSLKIMRAEFVTVTKKGQPNRSFHVYSESLGREKTEVIVRSLEEKRRKEMCEIYGDEISGLRIKELEKLLKGNPTRRFVPF